MASISIPRLAGTTLEVVGMPPEWSTSPQDPAVRLPQPAMGLVVGTSRLQRVTVATGPLGREVTVVMEGTSHSTAVMGGRAPEAPDFPHPPTELAVA